MTDSACHDFNFDYSDRMFIWRSLLKLPENHAAYSSLVDKGTHNAFARLHEEYPIKSRKLLRVLQRLVLCTLEVKCNPGFGMPHVNPGCSVCF